MTLQELGFTRGLEEYRTNENLTSFETGRVISEHKERYTVKTQDLEYESELLGNLRYSADSRYDLPAVGDWVAISAYDDHKALIHAVYPRFSIIERQAVGKKGQVQIIATNIDIGLIVQAVDRDFNLNRLERYLTICNASNADPIIVLSKTDLISKEQLAEIKNKINSRNEKLSIIAVSNKNYAGYDNLKKEIQKGKTYCLLGSSGVGKSTLLNGLSGQLLMETGHISTSMNKGRHITSHRELVVLNDGGILIDNPGMREVGISDVTDGLEITFESILDFTQNCKYKDCSHTNEKECGILAAIEEGELDEDAYFNYQKLEKEKNFFEMNSLDRKKKDKNMGKLIKQIIKEKKKTKF